MVAVSRSDFVKGASGAVLGAALVAAGVVPSTFACGAENAGAAEQWLAPPSPEFVQRVISLGGHLRFKDESGALSVDLTDADLRDRYGFDKNDVTHLRVIIVESARADKSIYESDYAVRSGARFYISNEDLTVGAFAVLATAAASSPEALAAAWVGVSSMIGGPVGTVAAAGVAVLGIGFFANLAFKITGALAQGKGVALYVDWGFPPLVPEIE